MLGIRRLLDVVVRAGRAGPAGVYGPAQGRQAAQQRGQLPPVAVPGPRVAAREQGEQEEEQVGGTEISPAANQRRRRG